MQYPLNLLPLLPCLKKTPPLYLFTEFSTQKLPTPFMLEATAVFWMDGNFLSYLLIQLLRHKLLVNKTLILGFDVAAQFEEFNQYWTILSRDIYTFCNTTNLRLTPITSQNLLGALGSSLLGSPSSFPPIPLPQRNPTLLDVTDVPTEYLLSSGLFYVEQYIYTPDSGEACWKTVRPCSWALVGELVLETYVKFWTQFC